MIGSTLKHYHLEGTLGKGGMGEVYLARDSRLERHVALKVLSREFVGDPDRRRRFFREARAASAVNHPAIAQIYEVDEVEGNTYIVMEHVAGETVRDLIVRRELDLLGAVEISIQVGEGLAKAHEAGIVHRDIKAANVMVTRDGHAKILDFGLAKLLDPEEDTPSETKEGPSPSQMETLTRTRAGTVLGTVAYMSPEQARGQSVDAKSDIFSMGILLYEMVTGQLPFRGDTALDTLHAIAFDETKPVSSIRPDIPASVQQVVSRCMRKRPQDRFESSGELVGALKNIQREIESGISQKIPVGERIREGIRSLRDLTPAEWAWPLAGAFLGLAFLGWMFAEGVLTIPLLIVMGVVGLLVYRRLRNRRSRLLKRFASKVQKMEEVRIIAFDKNQGTVVVDKAMARTYVRINSLLDKINGKLFFGEPFSVSVRDNFIAKETKALLEGRGVLYVRPDVLEEDSP